MRRPQRSETWLAGVPTASGVAVGDAVMRRASRFLKGWSEPEAGLDLAARQWLYSLGRCKHVHDIDHSAQVLAMLNNRGDELGRHSGLGGG